MTGIHLLLESIQYNTIQCNWRSVCLSHYLDLKAFSLNTRRQSLFELTVICAEAGGVGAAIMLAWFVNWSRNFETIVLKFAVRNIKTLLLKWLFMYVWKLGHRSSQTSRLCCVFAACLKHLYAATHFILIEKRTYCYDSWGDYACSYSEHSWCPNTRGKMPVVCCVRASVNADTCSQMPVVLCVQGWMNQFIWLRLMTESWGWRVDWYCVI